MPLGAAIATAVGGATSSIVNFVGQNKARKDRDAMIEDELRFQRESAKNDPNLYNLCVDQYENTGSISSICNEAGYTRSKIAQKSAEKSERNKKIIGGVVVAIIVLVVTYFLIIKK